MKTVAFYTLGCRLNFAETSAMRREFGNDAFKITDFEQPADIYVINTCSVTEDANRDCRKIVRRALRQNPGAFIAVTGCYAQLEPEHIASIKGVSLVVGAKDKFDLPALVMALEKPSEAVVYRSDVNETVDFHHAISSDDRTRAFLKIQDGCDYKCSFCTIPLARGISRSPKISEIIRQAEHAVDAGFKEIILTGVNAGDFGKNHNETLFKLLAELEKVAGIQRIRISSVEPNLLSEEIIKLVSESEKIQPHFHMPLQSGSDTMLRLMKRRYNRNLYKRRVEFIRKLIPDAAIGVDVITGHPGETERLFSDSFHFIQTLDVSYLHVFTYSERPNTQALTIGPIIAPEIRKRRTHLLRRLSDKIRWDYNNRFFNETRYVLFESGSRDDFIFGWTENYIRVRLPFNENLVNKILPVLLSKQNTNGIFDGVINDTIHCNTIGYSNTDHIVTSVSNG